MPVRGRCILVAPFCGFAAGTRVAGAAAAMSSMTAVPPMTTMAKHVHGNKGDSDQHPKPILRKPFHGVAPSSVVQAARRGPARCRISRASIFFTQTSRILFVRSMITPGLWSSSRPIADRAASDASHSSGQGRKASNNAATMPTALGRIFALG